VSLLNDMTAEGDKGQLLEPSDLEIAGVLGVSPDQVKSIDEDIVLLGPQAQECITNIANIVRPQNDSSENH
jgi:hypothetical protein